MSEGRPKVAMFAAGFAPAGTTLVRSLGAGSVFEVALLVDGRGRELVCKRAAPAARGSQGEAALARERDVLGAVKSPHLVELVASGSDERGGFLLEGKARGVPVRSFVDEGHPPLDGATWLELARTASSALASLHALHDDGGPLGFVHGDVSPDNVFFEPSLVTFVDFSSTTFRDAREPVFAADRGTLPYAAPEIARAEARASAETDTYALAAMLLVAAVGPSITEATTEASRLLEIGTRGLMAERIDQRSDLPERVKSALRRALRFDRAARLVSSRDLARELGKQVG
jgi:eukaryotic-like serine/threonine-protein kinase